MAAMAAKERTKARNSNSSNVVACSSSSYSYSSSHSSSSHYPSSSCSSISPPRYSYQHHSPPPRRLHASEHNSAREHLASLIRKHGPPTPVSSSSSLRKLTSTSPINTSFLPPNSVETPPASPAPTEETYESTAGSQPIPIPRANLNRSFDDLPITPLTGRFEYGLYLTERPSKDSQPSLNTHHTRNDKTSRKKKSRPATSSVSTSGSARSNRSTRRMLNSSGPSLAMPAQSGPVSPKTTPKDAPAYLGNLPRFHPAVYQSPNTTPNASLSTPTSTHHPRSFGYRVASGGGSREALRQYRELVAASISTSRNGWDSNAEISAPRLDPLGSPGPVTPLALEEADSYMAARPNASEERTPARQSDSVGERERHGSPRTKDHKGR